MKIGIRNIFKNTVEPVPAMPSETWNGLWASVTTGMYSESMIKMVLAPIFDELKKVKFIIDPSYKGQAEEVELQRIATFLNENYTIIYKYFFEKGFCALDINKKNGALTFDNQAMPHVKNQFELEISNPISAKTFELDFFQKAPKKLLADVIENINTGLTAQKAITKILGQFTFFSKEKEGANERVVAMTDLEKEKFETKFNTIFTGDNVGSAVSFTNANLKRDTILFPMEKLQIVDNVGFMILILAGVMNVPYDLIPITGKSTYANQAEAIAYLRTHTCTGIAENILTLGRKVLKQRVSTAPKSALQYEFIDDAILPTQPITPKTI